MTGAHTPGPWHVVPYGDGDSLVVCSDQDGEWRICFMATHGESAAVWDAIQANARLISEAPALVDVLSQAARWFEEYAVEHYAKARTAGSYGEQHGRESKGKRNQERANHIRAAIAKARGQDAPEPSTQTHTTKKKGE